jgi:hypothetical protein
MTEKGRFVIASPSTSLPPSLELRRDRQGKLTAAIRLAMQVVLRPPEAHRRIFPYQGEIPRCSRDSASQWIATLARLWRGALRLAMTGKGKVAFTCVQLGSRNWGILGLRDSGIKELESAIRNSLIRNSPICNSQFVVGFESVIRECSWLSTT